MFVVRDIFLAVARKIPRPWLAVSPTGETSLRLAQYVVRDIFLAVARKIPRPCLAVAKAFATSLRLAHSEKTCRRAGLFRLCAPTRIRTWDRLLKRELLYQLSYERI